MKLSTSAFLLVFMSSGVLADPLYHVTDLGTLGGDEAGANAINQHGDVVGWAYIPGNHDGHAFLYTGGSMHDIGTLSGTDSAALAVNDAQQVTGWSLRNGQSNRHFGFLYSNGQMAGINTIVPG